MWGKGVFSLFWLSYITLLQRWLGCLNKVWPISNPVPVGLGCFIFLLIIKLFIVKQQEKKKLIGSCVLYTWLTYRCKFSFCLDQLKREEVKKCSSIRLGLSSESQSIHISTAGWRKLWMTENMSWLWRRWVISVPCLLKWMLGHQ